MAVLFLLILLLLLLLLYLATRKGGTDEVPVVADDLVAARMADSLSRLDSLRIADSLARLDSLRIADSLARLLTVEDSLARLQDSLSRLDSLSRVRADSIAAARAGARAVADSLGRIRDSLARIDSLRIADSLSRRRAVEDSLARARDSLARLDSLKRADSLARVQAAADSLARVVDPCLRDTLMPWVTPDPSGGLHRGAVAVRLTPNKAGLVIEWSMDGTGNWTRYDNQPVAISKNSTLHYRATDNCGRKMDARSKRYVFDTADRSSQCPPDMEHISADGKSFCIDAYGWPNRRGVTPGSFVSLFQAMDSCFSVRKRLCTSDEWTTACAGPEKWAYTYGNVYEGNSCVVRDTMAQRSGSRPECRGYFGVFDMSGNLGEWTSTTSPHDRSFNNVMGGFWASGSQSRCADARYSYFPQNRHNPVGFRCCRDVGQAEPAGRRGGR